MRLLLTICFFLVCNNAVFAQGPEIEVTAGEPIIEELESSESAVFLGDVQVENEIVRGRVVSMDAWDEYEYSPGQAMVSAVLVVALEGQDEKILVDYNRSLGEGERRIRVGDEVLVNVSRDSLGTEVAYFVDYVREKALFGLFLIFVVLVLSVGGWKGVSSLVGLASSFGVIFGLILPGMQAGFDPVLVAIAGATLIMGLTFYVSHGVSDKTTIAVLGTLGSLVVTGLLAKVFVELVHLSGFGAEEASFLQVIKDGGLDVRGLLLAGMIIGTLGVLDDITISQVSIVKELLKTDKTLKGKRLFFKAMNVGRDHIASLVNTLILVYAGSSLPLLLLFTLDETRSIAEVVNYEIVAEEIVRTLVGSIGLVAAVPVTTLMAVYWWGRNKSS